MPADKDLFEPLMNEAAKIQEDKLDLPDKTDIEKETFDGIAAITNALSGTSKDVPLIGDSGADPAATPEEG